MRLSAFIATIGLLTMSASVARSQSCTGDSTYIDILFRYGSIFDETYARCLNVQRSTWDNMPSSVVDVDWSRCWTYTFPARCSTDNPANGLGRCLRASESMAAARNMCNYLKGELRG